MNMSELRMISKKAGTLQPGGNSAPQSGSAVNLRNLTKMYGGSAAVDNINISIGSGEFFTILGPSGSGKTTTMMMMAGFTHPTSGQIEIGNRNVADLPPQKRGLGIVFQNYAVFPHLSVYENIAFPLEIRGVSKSAIRQRVGEMLYLVQLTAHAQKKPLQLSGGQQQRVALARALVYRPQVLLMDEPLGALDKKLRETMQAEIRRIHKHLGVTVIYVTHDQEEALTMSDRIAIMRDGKVEQLDTPSMMYEAPNSRFVADFLGESNFIVGNAVGTTGEFTVVETDGGMQLHGVCGSDQALKGRIVGALRPERVTIGGAVAETVVNSCAGVIEETVYSGDCVRLRVRLSKADLISLKIQNRRAMEIYAVGSTVTVSWSAADMRFFPEEEHE